MNPRSLQRLGLSCVVLLLVSTFYLYPLSLHYPLIDPDEGLLASITQEMVERGDYVTPHFLGEPFLDKPILFFWTQALSLRVFGMNEAAVRLPGELFGLLGAVTTGLLGWRLFGRSAGLLAALIQATLLLPLALSQSAVQDLALVPMVNLALLGFWCARTAVGPVARGGWTVLAGAALGLACLTKGFLGVAFVGIAYGGYLVIRRQVRRADILTGLAALLVGALVALPWYLLMSLRNPGYAYYFFVERHLLGFVTSTQRHGRQPIWYYVPCLLGGALPWILYVPAAVQDWWEKRKNRNRDEAADAREFAWVWFVGGTLFIASARSKLVTYLLPVFPALALLIAATWRRALDGRASDRVGRTTFWIYWASYVMVALALPIALGVMAIVFEVRYPWPVWALVALPVLDGGLALRDRLPSTPSCLRTGLVWGLIYLVLMTSVFPSIAEDFSARRLAETLNRSGKLPPQLQIADARLGSLIFYLKPSLRRGLHPDQVQSIRPAELMRRQHAPPGSLVAIPILSVRKLNKFLDLASPRFEQAGSYRIYRSADLQVRPTLARRAAQEVVRGTRLR